MTAHAHPFTDKAAKREQARNYYPHALAFRLIVAAIIALAVLCAAALCFAADGPRSSDPRRQNGQAEPSPPPAWTITDHQPPAAADPAANCAAGNCGPQTAAARPVRQAGRRSFQAAGRLLGRLRGVCRSCN